MHYISDLKSTLSMSFPSSSGFIAELYGFLHGAGCAIFDDKGTPLLSFSTDNAAVARRYYGLIKEVFGYNPSFQIKKTRASKRGKCYVLDFKSEFYSREILGFYNIFDPFEKEFQTSIDPAFLKTKSEQSSYLKGLFLGCGYMSSPKKTYHLEFYINIYDRAVYLVEMLASFDIRANITRRGEYLSVYVKSRESIAIFFALIGAYQAMLDFENILILKDIRNDTVRLINSETANIHKTISSADAQIRAIQKIADNKGLDWLDERLQEAAHLRILYPSAPLSEICEYFSPKISRTAAHNRFKKIMTLADDL